MNKWTKEEVDFLIKNHSKMSNKEISNYLNKSLLSINSKSLKLNLKKNSDYISQINKDRVINKRWKEKTWTKDDINFLVDNINTLDNKELSVSLNRSIDSIVSMFGRLDIKRDRKYNKEYIEKECLKYITKSELRLADPNLYAWLYKNGKIKDVSKHMMNISYSTPQLILSEIVKIFNRDFNYNDREAIRPYEIDIYFKNYNMGIEYDGSYYHDISSIKDNICKAKNIKLITIRETNLTRRGFESYIINIKNQIKQSLDDMNFYLNTKITKEDIDKFKIKKENVFKNLFDIDKIKNICLKYNDYSKFIKEQKNIYNKLHYLGLLKEFTSHMKVIEEKNENEKLKYLIERNEFYKIGDRVLIEYWYNDMICEVVIIDKIGRSYKVSHNVPNSKIFNAPDEIIKSSDIIDFSR